MIENNNDNDVRVGFGVGSAGDGGTPHGLRIFAVITAAMAICGVAIMLLMLSLLLLFCVRFRRRLRSLSLIALRCWSLIDDSDDSALLLLLWPVNYWEHNRAPGWIILHLSLSWVDCSCPSLVAPRFAVSPDHPGKSHYHSVLFLGFRSGGEIVSNL